MQRERVNGIVLGRQNYAEADRIIRFITPQLGKISAIAKGARKQKSKLAGGIEPFAELELGVLRGRSNLFTITSAREIQTFNDLQADYDRLRLAADLLRWLSKLTEDEEGADRYQLALDMLQLLDRQLVNVQVVEAWFYLQLLEKDGQRPNLQTDSKGHELDSEEQYEFQVVEGAFARSERSSALPSEVIKAWRVLIGVTPTQLMAISGLDEAVEPGMPALRSFFNYLYE